MAVLTGDGGSWGTMLSDKLSEKKTQTSNLIWYSVKQNAWNLKTAKEIIGCKKSWSDNATHNKFFNIQAWLSKIGLYGEERIFYLALGFKKKNYNQTVYKIKKTNRC